MDYSIFLNHNSIYLTTFFTLTILLSLCKIIFLPCRKLPLPPGPRGFPIIGNMFMVDQLTHTGLARLAKLYGPLFHLKMGNLRMVVVSSSDVAREVLQIQDSVFCDRPTTMAINYLTYERTDMAFAHYGLYWKQMRKLFVMKIFSRRRAESWAVVHEEIGSLVGKIAAKVGSPVNIGELVINLTQGIIYRSAFGSISQDKTNEFGDIIQEYSKLFGAFHIADFLPWLGWIQGKGFTQRLEKARGSLDGFIDEIIDDHVAKRKRTKKDGDDSGNKDDNRDMVDELVEFYGENGEGKCNGGELKITRNNIKALIMDVMFGGTETVAGLIEWAMAELLRSKEELNKVQQELNTVVGPDQRVHEFHLPNLTYFNCVIKETLRLHPPFPLLLHQPIVNATIGRFRVPARSRVMINTWAIGRHVARTK